MVVLPASDTPANRNAFPLRIALAGWPALSVATAARAWFPSTPGIGQLTLYGPGAATVDATNDVIGADPDKTKDEPFRKRDAVIGLFAVPYRRGR